MRNEQLTALAQFVTDIRGPIVLLGDLNTSPWSFFFRRLLEQSGLRDSAKGYGVQPTWPSFFRPARIPIDHCLHSPDMVVTDRRVGEAFGSDHLPLIVELAFR